MDMVANLLKKAKNTNEASTGKIIEALLLHKDAQKYAEEKIFQ